MAAATYNKMFKFALYEKIAKHTCEAKCGRTKLLGVLNTKRYMPFLNDFLGMPKENIYEISYLLSNSMSGRIMFSLYNIKNVIGRGNT